MFPLKNLAHKGLKWDHHWNLYLQYCVHIHKEYQANS